MNIAIIHYSCPPLIGGVEEVVRQQALLFKRNFINVKLFVGKGAAFEKGIDVEVNPLLSSRNREIENSVESFLKGDRHKFDRLVSRIVRYLKKSLSGFDCVICHNVLSMRYNLPLAFALNRISQDVKVIAWNHDSLYFYKDLEEKYLRPPYTILKTYNPGITYVTISGARQVEFARIYGIESGKIHVIKNGVDPINFFKLSDVTVKIIYEEDLLNSDFIMFLPSRLHPRKNLELAISVTGELNLKGLKTKLLITGAYDPHEKKSILYMKKLKKMVRELNLKGKVIFLEGYRFKSGEVISSDRIKIRDLYLMSDILFLPSKQEGFGIPLLEASMIKLPVVCSLIPPFREIGGDNVLYFDLNESPSKIADKIIEFKRGYERFSFFRRTIKEYTWDNIFDRELFPLLKKVCGEKS